jgi:hypothetical protein
MPGGILIRVQMTKHGWNPLAVIHLLHIRGEPTKYTLPVYLTAGERKQA